MIVSHELSMIQMLAPKRHELASNVQAFLSKGGTIQELPGFGVAHQEPEFNRQMPPDFKHHAVRDEDAERLAKIKKLAKAMNRREVCAALDISLGVLRGIAKRHFITFAEGTKNFKAPNKVKPADESVMVEQIRECMEKRMTQNQAIKNICISSTLFRRLVKDHAIPYPVMTY